MANLNKVVYLTEAQKTTLFSTGTVTANGTTVTYNENDIYITPQVIDSTPTSGSSNLITSGAVAAAIPTIPSNVGAFTNDVGYITSADVPEGASAYTGTISSVGTTASAGTNNGFARGDHVHDIALATGDNNGQVKIAGTNVSVKGLGSNAYTSTSYLPLAGGTMTGGVTYTGNESSAYNDKGIIFNNGSRIGENSSGQLGLYSANKFYLRPNSASASSGKGIEMDNTFLIPTVTNEMSLGDSTHKWTTVYAATFNGNATSATGFASAKSIALTGDVTGSATGGNGSNGWSIATTIGTGKVTNAMLAGSIANEKLVNSKVTIAGNDVSLGGSLAADTLRSSLGLSSAMHFKGTTTTTMSDGLTTAAVTISGSSYTPSAGDVVLYGDNEFVWSGSAWLKLGDAGSFKTVQTAITNNTGSNDGTSTATRFIYSFSQTANGNVSVKTRSIPMASSSTAGITKIGASGGAAAYSHTHSYLPLSGGTMTGWVNFSSGGIQSSNNSNSGQLIFGSDFIGNNNSRYGVSLSSETSDGDSDEYINEVGVYNDGVFIRGTSTSLNDGPEIKLNKNGLVIDDGTTNGIGSNGQVLMSNGSKAYWGTVSTGSGTLTSVTASGTSPLNLTATPNGSIISITGSIDDVYVNKSGDTMTGNLTVSKSDGGAVKALNTEKGYAVSLDSNSSVGNHGVWSTGYWDGSAFQSDGKWIVYRGQSGNIYLDGRADTALADGDGNTITSTYVKKTGDTMTGQLHINLSHDIGGTAAPNDWAPFVIGAKDGEHIEMDTNEILCKSNGTTPTVLWLQDGTGTVKTGGKDASGVGLYVNTGNLQINNGYLKSVANGNTVTIGSQNGNFCHFMNNTNIPFYFNNKVVVDGNLDFYEPSTSAPKGVTRQGIGYSWYQGRAGALVRMTTTSSTSAYYPILSCKSSNGDWSVGTYQNELRFVYTTDNNYNSSSNTTVNSVYISATGGIYGAVWNDYAEMRNIPEAQKENPILKPGMCVHEVGDGTMVMSTSRLERGCKVISDTFGFNIGETENCKTPIAVSGRVLVYINEGREIASSHIGWPVCSGPNGTVSIMTEEEEEKYPSRIIGTISEIPNYDEWGTGNVKVDGRIWIYVK